MPSLCSRLRSASPLQRCSLGNHPVVEINLLTIVFRQKSTNHRRDDTSLQIQRSDDPTASCSRQGVGSAVETKTGNNSLRFDLKVGHGNSFSTDYVCSKSDSLCATVWLAASIDDG